jgi:hypothetical protein
MSASGAVYVMKTLQFCTMARPVAFDHPVE